jgi:hypothetical protein
MAKKSTGEKNRLSVCLPEDVAERLKLVALRQNRAASDVVTELLDRYLPRSEASETKKKTKIPYA